MSTRQHRAATYQRVFDERKRPVRGLWVRNGRYYAQLTIEDELTGLKRVKRVPLEGAMTTAQARDHLEELRVGRRKGELPVLRRTPKFEDYAKGYLDYHQTVKDAKRASTLETETHALNRWNEHLGHVRLDRITPAVVTGFIAKRQAAGLSARTVNLEVTVFRNVMKRALYEDKWITRLPTSHLRPLKHKAKARSLISAAQINKLCHEALKAVKDEERGEARPAYQNGQEFADYIRLMAYCGSRMSETLWLRWCDMDWNNRQLAIGTAAPTKNYKTRVVDFNPKLEAHLKEMFGRRQPDSEWLFPSPRRGSIDRPAKTFRETLLLVRKALPCLSSVSTTVGITSFPCV